MSTSLGSIPARPNMERGDGSKPELYVNRFFGGSDGVCSQLTVGSNYCQLDAEGIATLRAQLDELFPREQFVAIPVQDHRGRFDQVYGPFATYEAAAACASGLSSDPDECRVVPVHAPPAAPVSREVFEVLVKLYKASRLEVARLCDEDLDPSGALLGRVRAAAREGTA